MSSKVRIIPGVFAPVGALLAATLFVGVSGGHEMHDGTFPAATLFAGVSGGHEVQDGAAGAILHLMPTTHPGEAPQVLRRVEAAKKTNRMLHIDNYWNAPWFLVLTIGIRRQA